MDIPINPLFPQQRVNKTTVSNKDPHHEKQKNQDNTKEDVVEDEVTLTNKQPEQKKSTPNNPLTGHIDIEA